MTLIASYLNKYGVVQVSDSNLTTDFENTGFGQKIFSIPHLNASLSYSGTYYIDGRQLDEWMSDFVMGAFFTAVTIEEFTQQLAERMTREMRPNEINAVSIVHIAGFHQHNNQSHLEHWHISNAGLQRDGNYSSPRTDFGYSNDFNSRTKKEHRDFLIKMDESSIYSAMYINGFPEGRISYMHIKTEMDKILNGIWSESGWKFRPPKNLFESASIVKMLFEFVAHLFKLSNNKALYVGGEIQTNLIHAPQNLCKSIFSE
jgi:hypothetical protein